MERGSERNCPSLRDSPLFFVFQSIIAMTEEPNLVEDPQDVAPTDPTVSETPDAIDFDYVDLMLDGDLKSQVNYSFVKAIAAALDEKVRLLEEAEENIEGSDGEESFTEIALPEIEAMAQSITEGCVDFSKIHFWEACETAEIAWEESKDEEGNVVNRMPYGKPHDEPKDGNRLLANLEKIAGWLRSVHEVHADKGMGWVSPYGCPEDGQHAYDRRAECLAGIDEIIEQVKTNSDL